MSKVDSKLVGNSIAKVKVAYLQAASTWNGVFGTETTLDTNRFPGMEIDLLQSGQLLLTKGDQQAIIAAANVKLCIIK